MLLQDSLGSDSAMLDFSACRLGSTSRVCAGPRILECEDQRACASRLGEAYRIYGQQFQKTAPPSCRRQGGAISRISRYPDCAAAGEAIEDRDCYSRCVEVHFWTSA